MQDLEITWPEGEARFSVADSPIHLGRSSAAAVPLTEGSVSRKHLVLLWDGAGWRATDSSTHGTFDPAGVRLPATWTLSGERTIRLGGVEGVPVQIRPAQASAAVAQTVPHSAGLAQAESQADSTPAASRILAEPPRAESRPAAPPIIAEPPAVEPPVAEPVVAEQPVAEPASSPAAVHSDTNGFADVDGPNFESAPVDAADRNANDVAAGETPGVGVAEADLAGGAQRPEPSFGGLFAKPDQSTAANEPVLRFSEDSLFPSRNRDDGFLDQPTPSPSPDRSVAHNPPTPSLLQADTVSAFSEGPQGPPLNEPAAPPADDPTPRPSVLLEQPADAPSQAAGGPPPQSNAATRPQIPNPGPTGGHPAIDPNSTLISDATLRVNVAGQDYSFLPGADVTIGRDPSCLIQLDERHSLVSRKHLRITYDDSAWWLEDFSSKGTFVNGRKMKKPFKAEGAFVANLGDDDAGTPLRIITAGEHRVPRDKTTLIIAGLAAAALIPLIVLAVLLTRDNNTTVDPDFETAKKSTVMLFGLDGGQGSGFFVSDDLILTNQHVAVLSPQMLVGVSRQADQPARFEYATELVANHPFLDLAVLRVSNKVTSTAEGTEISSEPVGDIGIPAVEIGDSGEVTIGDRVFNTGFPGRLSITSLDDAGELRLPSVVATSGEAANFAFWPGCSNADADLYIPPDSPEGVGCSDSGDLEMGVLLSSFFSSGQGASGSAVYHNNEVVAVVYAGADGEDNANLSITTAVFSEWLDEIIADNP